MTGAALREEVAAAIQSMAFPQYAERFMSIRTKTQGVQPFVLNVGQLYLHRKIEMQMAARGYVRIVLLKARQWGGSTYIQGRSYYKVAARGARGMRSFILTHEQKATDNVFDMTHRFHNTLDPRIRPAARVSRSGIIFPRLDSSYAVATAGTKSVGRSQTVQFFHGSEVAYWPNADDHLMGVLQTIPSKGFDTEVYLESTGAGMGNAFHTYFSNARAQLGDYEAVFVPWIWFPFKEDGTREYSAAVRELDLTAEDEEYMELWGLSEEQMQFRQDKIIDFGGGEAGRLKFGIEYPCTPEEAFSQNITNGYIQAKHVLRARRRFEWLAPKYGPKIMGIDPMWGGDDRFVVWMRHGKVAKRVGRWSGDNPNLHITRCKLLVEKYQPDVICMDVGGPGGPLFTQLRGLVSDDIQMIPVMGGEQADDETRWRNKRSELLGRAKEWFEDTIAPSIDDLVASSEDEHQRNLEEIQGDITCVLIDWDGQGRPVAETKKKTLTHSPSPDNLEALMQTFAVTFGPDWKKQTKEDAMAHARRPVDWRAS